MTSSGSGSQFLLRRGGGEDSEGDERKRGVLDARRGGTSDEDRRRYPRVGPGSVVWRICVHVEKV